MEEAQQVRIGRDGKPVTEKVLKGDKGQQGSLLPPPSQTGEGLSVETTPLFGKADEHGGDHRPE